MEVRFGSIIGIIQANLTYIGQKLFGNCRKYSTELIT